MKTKKARGVPSPFQRRLRSLTKDGGGKWSARGLSMAAKLASPAHVGQYIRGDLKDPGIEIVTAIARAAGISPSWLAFGDELAEAGLDPRASALARLRSLLPEEVVSTVLGDQTERTEIGWLLMALDELRLYLRQHSLEEATGGKRLGDALEHLPPLLPPAGSSSRPPPAKKTPRRR